MKKLRQQYQLRLIRNLVEVGLTIKVPEVEILEQKILAVVIGVQKVPVVCLKMVVVVVKVCFLRNFFKQY